MTTVLKEAARNLRVFRLTTVANTCLVVYEYGIKLDDEVRYLWGRSFSFAGTLLFLCRYFPAASTLEALHTYVITSDVKSSPCLRGVIANSCLIYVQFSVSVLVLFTRAYAVWGATRRMLFILGTIYAAASAGTAYALYLHMRGYLPLELHIGNGCAFVIGNTHIWYALVIHIGCETLALVLLLIKSVEHVRVMKNVEVHGHDGRRGVNLMRVMAQDGIGYFLLNLAVTVTNVIVMMRVGTGLRDFLLTVHGGIQNILCGRLLFHLQTINEATLNGTYNTNYYCQRTSVITGIQFAGQESVVGVGMSESTDSSEVSALQLEIEENADGNVEGKKSGYGGWWYTNKEKGREEREKEKGGNGC